MNAIVSTRGATAQPGRSSQLRQVLAVVGVAITAIVWSWSALSLHPETYFNWAFLFHDAGHVLVIGDDLLAGHLLYRDTFYPYGPIPAYLYAAVAELFGSSPATLLHFQLVLSVIVAALSFQLLQRLFPRRQAFVFTIIVLFPLLLIPGSQLANFPAIWGCRSLLKPKRKAALDSAGGLLFLGAFFVIGAAIYFRHVWHFYQYSWCLALAALCACLRAERFLQLAVILIWTPTFFVTARGIVSPNRESLERYDFPSGEHLWLDSATRGEVRALDAFSREWQMDARQRPVVFFPDAAGFNHFLRVPHAGRFFFFMGGLVQQHDEPEFIHDLSGAEAIVAFFNSNHSVAPAGSPAEWARDFLMPVFSPEANSAISRLLERPIEIDDRCWVFTIRSAAGDAGQ